MKLIDADKIRYSDLSDGRVPEGIWCTWKDRIDAMPIVEAIPIEWFEKRMKEINEAMTHLYVEGCFYPKSDDYEERKNILLKRLAEIKLHGSAYDLVLNEWRVEKENEID